MHLHTPQVQCRCAHQAAGEKGPGHVRGGDQEDEILAQPRQAAQQVLALLTQQLVVGLADTCTCAALRRKCRCGAVAAQSLLRQPWIGMSQNGQ